MSIEEAIHLLQEAYEHATLEGLTEMAKSIEEGHPNITFWLFGHWHH